MKIIGVAELESRLAIANKIIDTLEEELTLYKKKYRDEVDNNEWKTKYRELLDGHWDQKMKQKSIKCNAGGRVLLAPSGCTWLASTTMTTWSTCSSTFIDLVAQSQVLQSR